MFGRVKSGLHQGVAQLQQEGFPPDFDAQIPPAAIFSVNMVHTATLEYDENMFLSPATILSPLFRHCMPTMVWTSMVI